MRPAPVHETLTFTRELAAPPLRAWTAYADPAERVRWGAPEGAAIVYDEAAEPAAGAVERYRCGAPDRLDISGETTYHAVDPGRGFVATETVRKDGELLSVALVTWGLEASGPGTRLRIVDQLVSLAGEDLVLGHRVGREGTLDLLAAHLSA